MLTFQSDSKPLAFITGCYQMDSFSKWNISHLQILAKEGKNFALFKILKKFLRS